MPRKDRPANGKQSVAPRTAVGFSKISIDNYRGIRHLKMDDLGQVNVIFGDNNCGKTTVLEALVMLTGPTNISLFVLADNARGLKWNSMEDMKQDFHHFSLDHSIRLTGTLLNETETREVTFRPFIESTVPQNIPSTEGKLENGDREKTTHLTEGLESIFKVRYNDGPEKEYPPIRLGLLPSGELDVRSPEELKFYEEKIKAWFRPSNAQLSLNSIEAIENLRAERNEAMLVKNLQKIISSAIKDIEVLKGRIHLELDGYKRRMPLNLMGSGTVRIVDMLAMIRDVSNHVFLIDEFENGLFHTTIDNMWKPFFEVVRETNAQFFLTTHSYDVLKFLSGYLEGNEADSSLMSFYDLSRLPEGKRFPEGGHKAYRYDVKSIIHNIEQGNEIRG